MTCSPRGFPGTSRRTRSRPARSERRQHGDLLDLTESNPTRVGLPYPTDALRAALGRTDPARYEPAALGLPAARAAVRPYTPRRGPSSTRARRDHRELQRIVLVPVQAAVRPGRRDADPGAELPAATTTWSVWRAPCRSAIAWRSTASGASTSRASKGAGRCAGARRAAPGDRRRQPEQSDGRLLEARRGDPPGRDRLRRRTVDRRRRGVRRLRLRARSGARRDGRPRAGTDRAAPVFSLGGLSKSCGLPHLKLAGSSSAGRDAEATMTGLELVADTYLSVAAPGPAGAAGAVRARRRHPRRDRRPRRRQPDRSRAGARTRAGVHPAAVGGRLVRRSCGCPPSAATKRGRPVW